MTDQRDNSKQPDKTKKRSGSSRKLRLKLEPKRLHRFGRTISVTIEENIIHLVTVDRNIFGVKLHNITRISIPPSSPAGDQREGFIVENISAYADKYRRRFTRCILAVSGTEAAFRVLSLPEMSSKELAEAVYWEGNKQIPFRLDNSYFGYNRIGKVSSDNKLETPIALTALAKREVDERLAILDKAGLKTDAVYYVSESIGHLLGYLEGSDTTRTHVVVNIKPTSCDIGFYLGQQLTFTHSHSAGSDQLSEDSPVSVSISQFAEMLVSEVQNLFDYYLGQYPNASIESVYVFGDFSDNDELINELGGQSGISFARFPTIFEKKSGLKIGQWLEQLPLSLGAAAAAISDYRMTDFLPQNLKDERDSAHYYRFAIPALILMVVVQLGFSASINYQAKIDKARLDNLNDQIASLQSSPSYILYHKVKRQMINDRSVLGLLENEPTFLNLNLKEISRITPSLIKLDQYELSKTESGYGLYLTGKAISSDPPPEIILAEYIARLERSPFFDSIILKRHIKRQHYKRFIVDFELEMSARL